ncbi:MAG: EsaB/YukD family protein [Lachnospiraceae bacterium]|nr:hypothetical protein [Lachnospiraceae bacterium]MDY3818552.1 EsaB/YukD family protein [Lachnospiraceae bacterium]
MINVDVYVPSIDEVLDFQLDECVPVTQIINEMTEVLSRRMRQEQQEIQGSFLLALPGERRILPGNLSLQKCGVENGNRLLLV